MSQELVFTAPTDPAELSAVDVGEGMPFSLLNSIEAPRPGKTYTIKTDGGIAKENNGIRLRFTVETVTGNLSDLERLLRSATPDQHITAGVCGHPNALAVSKKLREQMGDDAPAFLGLPVVGLGNDHFQFPDGEALMVIDSDDVEDGVSVWDAVVDAVPALEPYANVETSSSGANIYRKDTGECVRGATGQHLFLHVANGRDVPRALAALHKRLWLTGHGVIKVSAAGGLLERSPVDRQLAVPSQPIYLRSTMGEGLEQRKRIEYFEGVEVVDTATAIPDLTQTEEERYANLVAEAKLAALPESMEIQSDYIKARVSDMTARGVTRAAAEAAVQRSLTSQELQGDWPVVLSDGKTVMAKEILADLTKWHGTTCRDPLEPDYGSRTVAKIYSDQDQPCIFSQAHGGQVFKLMPDVVSMFAPLADWLNQRKADMQLDIELERQAALIKGWLDAVVIAGKDADLLGAEWLLHRLGVNGHALPESLSGAEFPPGRVRGLTCRLAGEPPKRIKLSSQTIAAVITAWATDNRDACLRGWAGVIATHAAIEGPDDPVAIGILASIGAIIKGTPTQRAKMLVDAWAAEQRAERELRASVTPTVKTAVDPAEQEAARRRAQQERESALKTAAGDLMSYPDLLGLAYRQAREHLGVIGEERIFKATIIAGLSPAFMRRSLILSLIVNGMSGSGKSFTSDCGLRFLPDEDKFIATSLSDKALFHLDENALAGRVFVLFEANALADPDNPLAMATRTLLTEGCIKYAVVEDALRDDGTIGKKTVIKEIPGPTSLITTTTKLFLDQETETRALFIETDDSAAQTRAIMLAGVDAVMSGEHRDAQLPPEIAVQWHALLEWVAGQPSRVAIPYWSTVVENTTTDVVRVRRDIGKLRSVITIHALLHRLHREMMENGAVVANADDYAFARQMVLPTLQRELGAGTDTDAGTSAVVECVRALIEKQKVEKKAYGSDVVSPFSSLENFDEIHISVRQLQTELKLHRSSLNRRLQKAFKAGLLENHETFKGKPMRLTVCLQTEGLCLLPTVEMVCGEGPPDWHADEPLAA
jgi:hypothetical protein